MDDRTTNVGLDLCPCEGMFENLIEHPPDFDREAHAKVELLLKVPSGRFVDVSVGFG